jgi:hypothetical protein
MLSLFLALFTALFSMEIQLINGTPAVKKDWPASVYATLSNSRCTATVIGEKVLLIAAHCVNDGGTASFTIGNNTYKATCSQSPDYKSNDTADWSLCSIDKSVSEIKYELVNQDPLVHKTGQVLQLTGYGCVKSPGTGGNDGIYRIGESIVTQIPSGTSNDIVTKGGGGAALCFGDSGGPAFLWDSAKKKRWVVAVNSRGDISTTSYLSSISTPKAKTFFKNWMNKTRLEICGISTTAKNCRNACRLPNAFVGANVTIQKGDWIILGGMPTFGSTYQWTPISTLDSSTDSMTIAMPTQTTTYTLKETNSCGSQENQITVTVR